MSSDSRPKTPKGSVKAARERAMAGLPRDPPPPPTIPRPMGSPKTLAISRPTAMPQWPLATGSGKNSPDKGRNSPADIGRVESPNGPPPRRPERPSKVPSILDGSKIQDHIPTFQYRQERMSEASSQESDQAQYWDPNFLASPPEPNTPGTGLSGTSASSRPSTTSSFGSIPDFPVPAIPASPSQAEKTQPRRSLGPPPTSRRGVSSYYSHNSIVAPIPEEAQESPKHQHGSYASSHVIPKSWADGPPEYYMTAYNEEDEEDESDVEIIDPREIRTTEHNGNSGLVRKASLGRQYKPSLTTVGSSSTLGHDAKEDRGYAGGAAAIAAAAGAALSSSTLSVKSSPRERLEMLTSDAYIEPNSGDIYNTPVRGTPKASGTSTPMSGVGDPRVRQILGGLEKGGALGTVEEATPFDNRRPPRLNIDAVREAESRGSLTSLPDLIRRATKLASNLDKGRTASRLGMLEMFNTSDPNMLARVHAANAAEAEKGRNSSISNMLSSFPAPALTPTGDRDEMTGSYENSNRELVTPMSPYRKGRRPGRRCCGMPLWVFVLLLLVLLIVIAAAVVIPIVLIVLPRNNSSAPVTVDLSDCPTSHPCSNGGTSVVSNNACQCVCTGKFTGSTCATADDGSCQTRNIGDFEDATVGSDFPDVLAAAADFQITLNGTAILASFSASNISCFSENALVSFSGNSLQRRGVEVVGMMDLFNVRAPEPQAVTSNGIVLASSAAPVPTAATVSGTAAPSPTATSGPSEKEQEFAGVAVLWVLQESLNLDTAAMAQSALSMNFEKSDPSSTIDVGGGVTVDFSKYHLISNGTTVNG